MVNKKDINMIDINPTNVQKLGYFCRMSKMKSKGNQNKLKWLEERFTEGLKIKMLELPNRGFIEYIPGEFAWRGVDAKGYMFIHCLWVVGKSKGKGYGELLLQECIEDARKSKMNGVAALVSDGNWMVTKDIFLKCGFEVVATAESSFQLVVKKFKEKKDPNFIDNWSKNLKKHNKGLTVFLSHQCPYLDDALTTMEKFAKENKIPLKVVELKSAEDVRQKSPSPHGAFNIVYDGKLLSYCYLLPNEIKKKIELLN